MKRFSWAVIIALFPGMTVRAQKVDIQEQNSGQSKRVAVLPRKVRMANVPACDPLAKWGFAMDRVYSNPVDEFSAAIEASAEEVMGKPQPDLPNSVGEDDPVWNDLMDCANQTQSTSQRTEALRVAAMWEGWRAQEFQKAYREAAPTPVPECGELKNLDIQINAIMPTKEDSDTYRLPDSFDQTVVSLVGCRDASRRVDYGRPVPQFVLAEEDLAKLNHASHVAQENRMLTQANAVVGDYNRLVEAHNELVERIRRNDRLDKAYADSLERAILLRSLFPRQTSCESTYYSYGTWGTATSTCH